MADNENIEFNPGDSNFGGTAYRPQEASGLTKLFMRLTGIEDKEKISKLMLGVAAAFFVLAIIVFFWFT